MKNPFGGGALPFHPAGGGGTPRPTHSGGPNFLVVPPLGTPSYMPVSEPAKLLLHTQRGSMAKQYRKPVVPLTKLGIFIAHTDKQTHIHTTVSTSLILPGCYFRYFQVVISDTSRLLFPILPGCYFRYFKVLLLYGMYFMLNLYL